MPKHNNRAGWFGSTRSVLNFLSVVNADRDDDGNYLLFGEPPASGYGADEFVVPAGTEYTVNGRRCNLAAGLRGTSGGVAVVVFT